LLGLLENSRDREILFLFRLKMVRARIHKFARLAGKFQGPANFVFILVENGPAQHQ